MLEPFRETYLSVLKDMAFTSRIAVPLMIASVAFRFTRALSPKPGGLRARRAVADLQLPVNVIPGIQLFDLFVVRRRQF